MRQMKSIKISKPQPLKKKIKLKLLHPKKKNRKRMELIKLFERETMRENFVEIMKRIK